MSLSDSEVLKAKIVGAVQERWRTQSSAYLLSQLGKDLAADVAAISSGRKLKQVIEADFATTLKLTHDPVRLWGVIPAGESMSEPKEAITDERTSVPKFQLPVWAAFRKILDANRRRFLVRRDNSYQFVDLQETDPPPLDTVFEIPPDQISAVGSPSSQVVEQIRLFIERAGLKLDDYLAKPFTQTTEAPGYRVRDRTHRSILDALLSALNPADQRRVSLPLDVVAKLRHHPIDQG